MEVTPWFRYSPKPNVSIFEYFRAIPVLKEDVPERTDTHYIDTRSMSRSYIFRIQWTNSELQIKLVQVVWVSLEQRITIKHCRYTKWTYSVESGYVSHRKVILKPPTLGGRARGSSHVGSEVCLRDTGWRSSEAMKLTSIGHLQLDLPPEICSQNFPSFWIWFCWDQQIFDLNKSWPNGYSTVTLYPLLFWLFEEIVRMLGNRSKKYMGTSTKPKCLYFLESKKHSWSWNISRYITNHTIPLTSHQKINKGLSDWLGLQHNLQDGNCEAIPQNVLPILSKCPFLLLFLEHKNWQIWNFQPPLGSPNFPAPSCES